MSFLSCASPSTTFRAVLGVTAHMKDGGRVRKSKVMEVRSEQPRWNAGLLLKNSGSLDWKVEMNSHQEALSDKLNK